MNAKHTLLLSATLLAATSTFQPAFAQDAGSDPEVIASATMPASRIADRYVTSGLFADDASADATINALRTGGDFTVSEQVTTTTTNPDGTTTTTTSTVERSIVNPNGPMGYGEVNITLALAERLLASGEYTDLQSALTGVTSTVTNADGTTTASTSGGVLAMRADGMGWGKIAKELGFNLGSVMSAGNRSDKAVAGAQRSNQAKTERAERVARVERPVRPERAQRPERPERPQKPERGGRP
ncbi:hypothetical protein [Lysobacter olei]